MKDINGYISNIEDDRLNVLIVLDDWIPDLAENKVKVIFEYQIDMGPEGEYQFEEKEFIGEVISTDEGSNELYIKFDTEVPKELNDYDNVEVTKIPEEGSQIE